MPTRLQGWLPRLLPQPRVVPAAQGMVGWGSSPPVLGLCLPPCFLGCGGAIDLYSTPRRPGGSQGERPQRPRDWPRSGSSSLFFRSLHRGHLTKALLTTETAPDTHSLSHPCVLFYAEHLSLSGIILIMRLHAFYLSRLPPAPTWRLSFVRMGTGTAPTLLAITSPTPRTEQMPPRCWLTDGKE